MKTKQKNKAKLLKFRKSLKGILITLLFYGMTFFSSLGFVWGGSALVYIMADKGYNITSFIMLSFIMLSFKLFGLWLGLCIVLAVSLIFIKIVANNEKNWGGRKDGKKRSKF